MRFLIAVWVSILTLLTQNALAHGDESHDSDSDETHHDRPTKTKSSKTPVVSLLMFNTKQQPLKATVVAAERPAGPTTFQIRCDSPNNKALCSLKQPTIVRLTPGKSYELNTIQDGDQVNYKCSLKSQQPIKCTFKSGDETDTFTPGVGLDYKYFFLPVTVTQGAKMLGKLPQEMSADDNSANQSPSSTAKSTSNPSSGATQKAINGEDAPGAAPGYGADLRITAWLAAAIALGGILVAA